MNNYSNNNIDISAIGNIGRYANHCCDPNVLIVPVRIETIIPHLALVAGRDIPQVFTSYLISRLILLKIMKGTEKVIWA